MHKQPFETVKGNCINLYTFRQIGSSNQNLMNDIISVIIIFNKMDTAMEVAAQAIVLNQK